MKDYGFTLLVIVAEKSIVVRCLGRERTTRSTSSSKSILSIRSASSITWTMKTMSMNTPELWKKHFQEYGERKKNCCINSFSHTCKNYHIVHIHRIHIYSWCSNKIIESNFNISKLMVILQNWWSTEAKLILNELLLPDSTYIIRSELLICESSVITQKLNCTFSGGYNTIFKVARSLYYNHSLECTFANSVMTLSSMEFDTSFLTLALRKTQFSSNVTLSANMQYAGLSGLFSGGIILVYQDFSMNIMQLKDSNVFITF